MTDQKKAGLTVTIVGTGRMAMTVATQLAGQQGPMVREHSPEADPILPDPFLAGPGATIWAIDFDRLRETKGGGREDGGVAGWIIECPAAHPIWHSYVLQLIHLRPVPEMSDPVIHLPGATHEMLLFAIDPAKKRNPVVMGEEHPAYLEPVNFGAQLIAESDEAAVALVVDQALGPLSRGELNPDTDGLGQWVARFSDNMLRGRRR